MNSIVPLQSEIEQRGREIFALIDKFQGNTAVFRRQRLLQPVDGVVDEGRSI